MGKTQRKGFDSDGEYQRDRRDGSGKGCGYEYWSRRPLSGYSPSAENKRLTHRIERARHKQQLRKELTPEEPIVLESISGFNEQAYLDDLYDDWYE